MRTYFINSFLFQKNLFERELSNKFTFSFSPPFVKRPMRATVYVILNMAHMAYLSVTGTLRRFHVIHFNRPEGFLFFRKRHNQVSVFEIHGFDVGVSAMFYLRDIHNPIKQKVGSLLDKMISPIIIKKIQKVDLFYCSTPDLVQPIEEWCGRKPVWLPNPIDLSMFSRKEPIKKRTGPVNCFLAARLHGDKKPEIAIRIFEHSIKPHFPDAKLHLIETGEFATVYKKMYNDPSTYIWHEYMDKESLVDLISASDLVFGDFSIGALSLMPMQVMALRRPIVTFDRYELIKLEIDELGEYAIKLLTDATFCEEQIERNYRYIQEVHSEKAVCEAHLRNIESILREKI